jgi:hypothetical protein
MVTCKRCGCQFYVTGKAWENYDSYFRDEDHDHDDDDDHDRSVLDYCIACEWPKCGRLISITKNQYEVLKSALDEDSLEEE